MIHLDYRDARTIYSQVFDAFKTQIESGILQPGEKLPSVRELAATLAINPNTIQRAYRELENEGFIGSMAGKGSFVLERTGAEVPARGTEKADTANKDGAKLRTSGTTETLLHNFDDIAAKLLDAGVSASELQERIRRINHA